MRLIGIFVCLIYLVQSEVSFAQDKHQLTIIIDDLGNNKNDLQVLTLPIEVSFSILPYTTYAQQIARRGQQQGRTILAHIPMQARKDNHKLGKGALMNDMSESDFKNQLKRSLDYLPEAQGINNHMGSRLTELKRPMIWTMEVLQSRALFFLDSRTSVNTIAQQTAETFAVPALRRHVFLDNIKTEQAMEEQFQRALNLSKQTINVIIIAHPYPETLSFLNKKLLQNKETNFTLVAINQLIPETQGLALLQKQQQFATIN
ncbi:divergent polysaccharide deacetylase family protein [Psychromonas sp. MME2]|uniref:divergent polysaccharide deacetylase family protein n=1 Tax=unclassified Psychromonas TaxID=2614957 RepID=UPI00339C843A